MAKEGSNGSSQVTTKPPPEPSPLRKAKFFQANMRILVTGGAGFIGSHLVDKLMENEKNEVIVADNYFTGSKDNLRQWIGHPQFELIRHDNWNLEHEVYNDPFIHPQTEDYSGNVNPTDTAVEMVSPDVAYVANAFVSQYYNVLDQFPQNAHKFYGESSVLTWPDTDGGVTTISKINDKILSSVFKDVTLEIKTADSQASHDGGIIVAVTGVFNYKDKVSSNFYQTFFLAKQEKGFFVLNDILRVSDARVPVVNNVAADDSNVGGNVSDSPTPSLPTKESDISVVSGDSVAKGPVELASNGHVSLVDEPAASADLAPVSVPASSATVPPVDELGSIAKVASVEASSSSAGVPPVDEQASKVNLLSVVTSAPNVPSSISYASMVAKPVQVTTPKSAPVTPKASSPLSNGAPEASSQQSKAAPKLPPGGNSMPDTTRARPESRIIYVGNLPSDITKHQVADAFRQFGAIRRYSDSVQIRRYEGDGYSSAFVEFESADSANRAVKARGNLKIGEKIVYIALRSGYRNGKGNQSGYDKGSQARGSQQNQSGNDKAVQARASQRNQSSFQGASGQARGSQQNQSSVQGGR